MIQQPGVRAEAHPVGYFDPVPQLCDRVRRVDTKDVAGDRLVGAERVELERSDEDATLRVDRKIVETARRAAFPFGKDIVALLRRLIPADQAASAAYDSARRVQRDSADAAPAGNESLDDTLGVSPVNAAIEHVAEVEPVAFVDARPLDKTVTVRQGFELHREILHCPFSTARGGAARTAMGRG